MDVELKIGTMPRPRIRYEYCGGIQPDRSIWLQRILKQPYETPELPASRDFLISHSSILTQESRADHRTTVPPSV